MRVLIKLQLMQNIKYSLYYEGANLYVLKCIQKLDIQIYKYIATSINKLNSLLNKLHPSTKFSAKE